RQRSGSSPWQLNLEGGPFLTRNQLDCPAMGFCDLAHDRKPKPDAFRAPGHEWFKQPLTQFLADTRPGVAYPQTQARLIAEAIESDAPAWRRARDGIENEIIQGAANPVNIKQWPIELAVMRTE